VNSIPVTTNVLISANQSRAVAFEPTRRARSQATSTSRSKMAAAVRPCQMRGYTPTLDSPMVPVMSATRGFGPTRPCVAWTSSDTNTVCPKPLGARISKGRNGTAIPATNPPANGSRPRLAVRHNIHAIRAGTAAQILTAAANPKQTPAHRAPRLRPCGPPGSRRPVIRSPSNRNTAPSRQNRFSHGSRNSDCEAFSAAG
jgi:hypothetical protein